MLPEALIDNLFVQVSVLINSMMTFSFRRGIAPFRTKF